jgi:16S rRNA processing protein RimM
MIPEKLRVFGKLSKLHAFEGEAFLISEWEFSKNDIKTEWVFLKIDGLPVPFFISSFRLRSDTCATIKLEDIDSDKKMLPYIGMDIFVEDIRKKRIPRKKTEVEGYQVIDKISGPIGIAKTVLNYNNNFLLQVFRNNLEILIPVNENIITDIDDRRKTISASLPEGFLDLYPD